MSTPRFILFSVCKRRLSGGMTPPIALLDVIVSNGPICTATLFHELVHVVQYRKLGLSEFAAKYVTGFLRGGSYEQIPLEINAYQLDTEYTRNPKRHFAVDDRVQAWIDGECSPLS